MKNNKAVSFLGFWSLLTSLLVSTISFASSPSQQVLVRALGQQNAEKFVLELRPSNENDWFEIEVKENKIHIVGNSPVALSKGAYSYIKSNHYGVVTWEGTNVTIPDALESKVYPRTTSDMNTRMYINPVTYGYTMAWWTWERWEQELDWMALHGINMPVALLGQEIIWQDVWEDIGINKNELADYHTGPGFLPWFRMGNIYNHHGPLPQSAMQREKALQKKIIDRMKQLGMRPIVPAFSGHVPPRFTSLYPESTTYSLENWGGLEKEKASLLLDPKDPMFAKIGKLFLQKYEDVYGKADLFLADSFNEMLPPVSEEGKNQELSEYGAAIYKSIREHNANATWVLQGWTFGHQNSFWTSEATQAFFSQIPKDNLLMLNYGEDRYPIWEKLDAFYGYKWTYGYVHNYGGQQSLFGDMHFYYEQYRDLIDNPDKGNLVGYGALPEAIENNSVAYEYIFDVPWGATDKPVSHWVNEHNTNRYGKLTPKVKEAWNIALDNTYTLREWRGVTDSPVMNWLNDNVFNRYEGITKFAIAAHDFFTNWGEDESDEKVEKKVVGLGYGTYIHNNRPLLNQTDIENYIGNPESLVEVLSLLLEEEHKFQDSDLYYYDIIDFAQHYTAYKVDDYLVKASHYYQDNQFKKGDEALATTKELMKKLELLQVITGGSFTQWCEDAVALATNEQEYALYLENAKAQITVWGGDRLKDYASKSWSGLLLNFYLPRWEMFFEQYKQSKGNFDQDAAREAITQWENNWVQQPGIPASPTPLTKAENLVLVKEIISNY